MLIKVLGNWEYNPEMEGAEDFRVILHPLSGVEELELGTDRNQKSFFKAIVNKLVNPFQLEVGGKQRKLKVEDICDYAELKELYFNIIVAYNSKTVVSEADAKNS